MIHGIPNRPLYFYQKDIIGKCCCFQLHVATHPWGKPKPAEAAEPSKLAASQSTAPRPEPSQRPSLFYSWETVQMGIIIYSNNGDDAAMGI